jgi:acetylornithine/succinyldiaminopimelate/putrescine aminotransferase
MGYRGRGLMWGIVVSAPAKDLVQMALDRGLILNAPKPNVIRLLPPLIVGEEGIAGFYDILSEVLEQWRHTAR